MASTSIRPELGDSIRSSQADMLRTASDMQETTMRTRALINATREQMRDADRLLAAKLRED